MKPEHIKAVQQSWALLEPIPDQAAELFYTNLFARNPGMRLLFTGDLDVQGGQLMQMFGQAVSGLDHPEQLVPMLQALGQRHRDYGVTPLHFDAYGEALFRTLAQGLGTAFTPEVVEAWRTIFAEIRGVMLGTQSTMH